MNTHCTSDPNEAHQTDRVILHQLGPDDTDAFLRARLR